MTCIGRLQRLNTIEVPVDRWRPVLSGHSRTYRLFIVVQYLLVAFQALLYALAPFFGVEHGG